LDEPSREAFTAAYWMSSIETSECGTYLIDQILQIGTAHTRTTSCDNASIDIGVDADVGHVMLENLDPATNIG
jgi:hypothetical protein